MATATTTVDAGFLLRNDDGASAAADATQQQQQTCQTVTITRAHHSSTTTATTMQEDSAMKDLPKKATLARTIPATRSVQASVWNNQCSQSIPPLASIWESGVAKPKRQAYRAYHNSSDKKPAKKGSTLTAQRIQALNDIEMVWNTLKEPLIPLETRLEQMRSYRLQYGH
jgi:hypothetical protein